MNASKNLNNAALRYLGKDVNYKSFLTSISRLSYLHQHELGQSIRLAYLCRNSPAMAATFFAMTNTRSVNIPINPDLPPDEITEWLHESQATHLAVTSDLLSRARDLLQSGRINLPIIEIEKKQGGEYDSSFTPPPDQEPKETDPVLLLRSSGATGKPRFASFTHKQLIHAATAIRGHYHLLSHDRIYTNLSWSYPFPFLHGMLFPLMAGVTCVIDHGLEATELLDFFADSRITRIINTPPFFFKLLVVCKNEKKIISGIKSITVGNGTLSTELKKAFDLIKIPVSHCYGQIENLWTIAMEDTKVESETHSSGGNYIRGFVGKGLPGLKYKVLDENGDEITGKGPRLGMLAVSGPSVMEGYLGLEKETKQTIRGTWLYTGDIVQLDGDQTDLKMTFIGRKDDVLITDGNRVDFHKIDSVLRGAPSTQDAAAFMIKTSKGEPVIVCAVVKKVGATLNEKQIIAHCESALPEYMLPKAIGFTDVIPRDIGGNVLSPKLRAQFSGLAG